MDESGTRLSVENLLVSLRSVRGRKKLQKLAYLLKTFGAPLAAEFGFHFYGPYSDQLANEVQWLVDTDRIAEREDRTASGHSEFVYEVPDGTEANPLDPSLLAAACAMNEKSARFLELAATIRYLVLSGLPVGLAKERARDLKPSQHYSDEEAEEAVNCLAEWEQVAQLDSRR